MSATDSLPATVTMGDEPGPSDSERSPHLYLANFIEHRTKKNLTIETVETNETLARCDMQTQSPIFSLLPREIRDLIWQFATAQYKDEQHQYKKNEYYYRPGHTARAKTDTNLLLTCRRIWLEANAFPMLQAEQCFWYYREAPDGRNPDWMSSLTTWNRRNLGNLHLYAQMFAIKDLTSEAGQLRNYFLRSTPRPADFQPRMLHVTLR